MKSRSVEVLVIGAGAAGLSAARDLSDAGIRVLVLEAKTRIGGRIWTVQPRRWPLPVELGAEFIHGRAQETFRIVDEARLLVDRLPDLHWTITPHGLEPIANFWEKVDGITRRMRRAGSDRSVADFLRRTALPRRLKRLAAFFVEGYHAAPLDRISEHSLSTAGEEAADPGESAQFRLVGGYGGVTDFLRSRLDPRRARVRLGAAVTELRWKRGSVTARTDRGQEIRAARALVTVSLGVLKAAPDSRGAILFDPPLEDKSSALAKLEMGPAVRTVFRFRERFWQKPGFLERRVANGGSLRPDRGLGFFYRRGAAVPTWWTPAPAEVAMLTGWAGGPAAEALRGGARRERISAAIGSLAQLLGVRRGRLERLLEGSHTHDWSADPFVRGAYSYELVGAGSARQALARPIDRTLFFAGEATDPEASGTVDGALASGRRAAEEILGE